MSAAIRADFETIAGWVKPGARVLDLGCGDGALLAFLRERRGVTGYGVEIDDERVIASVRNGVSVLQMDLEAGLSGFASDTFDHVILSQTLQAVRHTERLLAEMLRVGREGIVSFPNFGHWRVRLAIALGRMPVSRELPYQWYDTPNIHLFTLHDFEDFCASHGMRILERRVLSGGVPVARLPNLFAATAAYRFERAG
ncbi:MAG: methionine biosynthesis protein MetW [Burkholderiales bacterium]|nr:methionine biosynthesis protein MetW [Burkholderiales bacterium]